MELQTEKYLILRMADLLKKWEEPYDDMDREQMQKNAPIEREFEILESMLRDHWDGKF